MFVKVSTNGETECAPGWPGGTVAGLSLERHPGAVTILTVMTGDWLRVKDCFHHGTTKDLIRRRLALKLVSYRGTFERSVTGSFFP